MSRRGPPPPPPTRPDTSRRTLGTSSSDTIRSNGASPLYRHSTINVQPSYQTLDIDIPEPSQTEAGKWTFHSQREFPPPPPFEKKLRRYPTGAETGCSLPIDLSHLYS
ncbi:uncharacterized protein BX664DRAFT_287568 [Halteromyces radiatus]|uniref:uncharacterized protein n=1 Tax=Halteromyces radiatus TaxID=101107 RepID=UPI00221FD77E|nr:uncharacterized protein BX664DRAFT_287568 [Halteromyces radiatus]KAI8076772.1 hypothetical protein BX664DRAFT_287568 [Halteromyces radiatus]